MRVRVWVKQVVVDVDVDPDTGLGSASDWLRLLLLRLSIPDEGTNRDIAHSTILLPSSGTASTYYCSHTLYSNYNTLLRYKQNTHIYRRLSSIRQR